MEIISKRLREQVREFCAAALRGHSYNLFKNPYIWFGIFWGMPVPVVTISLYVFFTNPTSTEAFRHSALATALQWFFLAHPIFFGALFGILGTIRTDKEQQISELIDELWRTSTLDPLTGLSNRRHFVQVFDEEMARANRNGEPLSLVFFDLDHFKRINDTYGHHVGDQVLCESAELIKKHCRQYDLPARWGGEEFVILLPSVDIGGATMIADRIREGFVTDCCRAMPFTQTISGGVAQLLPDDSLETLADRADQALYAAKNSGRNRVVAWKNELG